MTEKNRFLESGHRQYSKLVTETNARAASRGMLYGVGFKKEDFQKSQVGIASTWSMVTPCNMHINQLAESAASGADSVGSKSVIFKAQATIDPAPEPLPGPTGILFFFAQFIA